MALARSAQVRLRINHHGLADYPPGATFGPRTLRDCEFVLIIEGDVVWMSDGVEYLAPMGTLLLARPGMRDGFRWDPIRRTRHSFFHFTIEDRAGALPDASAWPMTRRLPTGDVIRPIFHHLDWLLWTRPADHEELAEGMLRQALLAYITGALGTLSERPGELHPAIELAMQQVRLAWADGLLRPLSLAGLARAGGVSRAHLARLFTREIGASPVEALRIMRLDRAATLLARTNLPVGTISESCGFANAFHFSRLFHRQYGMSPRAFRTRLATGMDMPVIAIARHRDLIARVWLRNG